MSRERRADDDYTYQTGLQVLKVLEALEGTNFEPVTVERVQQRTKLSYDVCRRSLFTLKKAGFATYNGGWQMGPKALRLSERFNEVCIAALSAENAAGRADDEP